MQSSESGRAGALRGAGSPLWQMCLSVTSHPWRYESPNRCLTSKVTPAIHTHTHTAVQRYAHAQYNLLPRQEELLRMRSERATNVHLDDSKMTKENLHFPFKHLFVGWKSVVFKRASFSLIKSSDSNTNFQMLFLISDFCDLKRTHQY